MRPPWESLESAGEVSPRKRHVFFILAAAIYASLLSLSAFDEDSLLSLRDVWVGATAAAAETYLSREARAEAGLRRLALRYYLYNDTRMTRRSELKTKLPDVAALFRWGVRAEDLIHDALERHPMRTHDAERVDVFIVPTPIGQFLVHQESPGLYHRAFEALVSTPTFRSTMGNRHVILALVDFFRNPWFSAWFGRLANVTIARADDVNPCRDLVDWGGLDGHDYQPLFSRYRRLTRTMSIGLMPEEFVPFLPATYEKYQNCSIFLFYRTRTSPSRYNSTRFRHAPLKVSDRLPNSSIGHDLPRDVWLKHLTDAKFCPVIRGDSPHSHALFTAIRVGCIPVVISDYYPVYAPPFKSTLDMRDFCVFIEESAFIEDPAGRLNALRNLSETVVRKKLAALALAQKVVFIDHPDTLFVEAFLKEVVQSQNQSVPSSSS